MGNRGTAEPTPSQNLVTSGWAHPRRWKKGCSLASRGLSLPGQKPSRVRGKSGLRSLAGPVSAARRERARPKRVPTRGGSTHVRSPPAQQSSTVGKRRPRASAPRSPEWRAPGPAHAEGGTSETLRRKEGRKRRTLQGPGLGEQSFATSPRRGQQEAAPSIPCCCRGGEPGPARPGRKTEARSGAGPGDKAGPGEGRGQGRPGCCLAAA